MVGLWNFKIEVLDLGEFQISDHNFTFYIIRTVHFYNVKSLSSQKKTLPRGMRPCCAELTVASV